MGKNKKRLLRYILVTLGILIFLIILMVGFIRPINGMITEGKPFLSFLCNLQVDCGDKPKPLDCRNYDNEYWINNLPTYERERVYRLKNWEGYHGCNESTMGFIESKENDYINIKYCSCGYPV